MNSRVAELAIRITDIYQLNIVQVYAATTSHSDEETGNFYNTIDKTLEKQTQYTIILLSRGNAKVGGQTNTAKIAHDASGMGQRNERGGTLTELATSNNVKIINNTFKTKQGRYGHGEYLMETLQMK